MNHDGFRDFLKNEMKQRNMSMREFAALIGISHTTIVRFTADPLRSENIPTIDLLEKLSQATNVSLSALLALCFPETARKLEVDPEVALIADEIASLPSESRQIVMKFVRSLRE